VKEDDTSLHSWNEYRFPHFEYRKPQRYSTGRGSYSSSYSPYRDFPTLPSPLNRALPHQRRPHHIKHTHRVQTIIEMDEQSTTSEEQLHEVAHYGTLDGRPGALEYSGFQWLQNRPAQPNPPPVSPPRVPFNPTPTAIQRNESLIKAFKAAPNVLYERYCQFGQLGVLGWCAEFEELISEVKGLGISGDMADATRDCALQTCRDILKLQLDVQMQLIILYLSGQISRLRAFLDQNGDEDYPIPSFPLPSEEYDHP